MLSLSEKVGSVQVEEAYKIPGGSMYAFHDIFKF